MTRPHNAGEIAPRAVSRAAERVLLAAPIVFLAAAPLAGSSGLRTACLLLAAGALALLCARHAKRLPPPPPGFVALFAAWSALAAASLAWTVRPDYSLSELRVEILYVALTIGIFFAAADAPPRWRRWCVAIFAGIALAWAARAGHEALDLNWWRHPPDGGPGPYSTHLVLAAAILPTIAAPPPWGLGRRSVTFVLAWIAIFAAAWTTGNRIVWPALLVVLVITLAGARRVPGFALGSRRGLQVAVAIASLAIATAFTASIAERSDQFFRGDERLTASIERDLRPQLWKTAWVAWREAPWLGHGFGREILEERFFSQTPAGEDHPRVHHAHNTFLNVALELGLVGLALFMGLLAVLAREYWRMLARPEVAILGLMGLAMLGGFLVKNLTDDFFYRHNALAFWALSGAVLGFGRRAAPRGS